MEPRHKTIILGFLTLISHVVDLKEIEVLNKIDRSIVGKTVVIRTPFYFIF